MSCEINSFNILSILNFWFCLWIKHINKIDVLLLKTVQYESFVVEDFNGNVILVIELTSSIFIAYKCTTFL